MRITISGTPGSGKSTATRLLTEALGYPHLNAGQVFRDAATTRGMSLGAFGTYVNAHLRVDRALDRMLLARARAHEHLILEGRLAGWITYRAKLPALRVWITASERTRIARLRKRDGDPAGTTRSKLRERSASEAARYQKNYGIDIADRTPYDLVIRTDHLTPRQVVRTILTAVRQQTTPSRTYGRIATHPRSRSRTRLEPPTRGRRSRASTREGSQRKGRGKGTHSGV